MDIIVDDECWNCMNLTGHDNDSGAFELSCEEGYDVQNKTEMPCSKYDWDMVNED